jgi:molybdopterin-guanine dinucleotide biosynthesis protein A
MSPPGPLPFDAVILAGGRGRRMGGVDKAALEVGGTSLLQRAVDAAGSAERIVVVGPERAARPGSARPVEWVREEPPGGGPVAALEAGLQRVGAGAIVVLGCDLPAIDAGAVAELVAELADPETDAALAVDDSGRDQYLCAAYRTAALRERLDLAPGTAGSSMHALVDGLRVSRLRLGTKAADIDTPDDLTRFT